ncbi:MAG TPA: hypothetical protein PKK26_11000 [Candidatus Wallbacteria bacterium]|nr:hypothetical protein [Candidatus Wallbacteria bacterium]
MPQNFIETHCKSCGRYIGACEVCHFCRTFNPKRTSVRLLKYLSPVVAVLGLFVLQYIGVHYGNPEVKLDSLSRRSNFAQITVKAAVNGPVKYYAATDKGEESGGSMEFEIDDNSALMLVRCYDDATRELVDSKKIPCLGDKIKLRASFQHKGKGGMLILGSAYGIDIERTVPAKATPLKNFTNQTPENLKKGERVKVSGRISDVSDGRYETNITIDDMASGTVTASIPLSVLQINKLVKENPEEWKERPKAGDLVTITGAVDWRGKKGSAFPVIVIPETQAIVKTDEATVKTDNI